MGSCFCLRVDDDSDDDDDVDSRPEWHRYIDFTFNLFTSDQIHRHADMAITYTASHLESSIWYVGMTKLTRKMSYVSWPGPIARIHDHCGLTMRRNYQAGERPRYQVWSSMPIYNLAFIPVSPS